MMMMMKMMMMMMMMMLANQACVSSLTVEERSGVSCAE
jgi:hypothetical protein